MRALCFIGLCVSFGVAACGGSSPPAQEPDDDKPVATGQSDDDEAPPPADEEEAEGEETSGVPTKCAKQQGDVCSPSKKWIQKLCNDSYPSLALNLFSGGTPWTRGYIAVREVEPVNAFGGLAGGENLTLDEEVIILFETGGDLNGMQVSGAGSHQIFRWNGTCATLASGEVRRQHGGRAKAAKVQWRYLESGTQDALRKEERITKAYRARRKECKGATMGTVSDKCEKYDRELHETIVEIVRSGSVELPVPEKVP